MKRLATAVLIARGHGRFLAGCVAPEPWIAGLDRAPESAAEARDVPERLPLDPDATFHPGKEADLSPAYLGPASRSESEQEIAKIQQKDKVSIADAVRLAELNSKDLVASYEAIVAAHGA